MMLPPPPKTPCLDLSRPGTFFSATAAPTIPPSSSFLFFVRLVTKCETQIFCQSLFHSLAIDALSRFPIDQQSISLFERGYPFTFTKKLTCHAFPSTAKQAHNIEANILTFT
mmetsp:Transcript_15581/g.22364  ORF Transcript_15581/g.22364 Transcript_15581/m.22364 type:complete len:112 (-) Transcript_15581:309-644(-)